LKKTLTRPRLEISLSTARRCSATLLLALLLAAPASGSEGLVPQDDGGSGGDAPDTPTTLVPIADGQRLRGAIVSTFTLAAPHADIDHYWFAARAGDVVDVKIAGVEACVHVVDAQGAPVAHAWLYGNPGVCATRVLGLLDPETWGVIGQDTATIPADGTYFVRVETARPAGATPYEIALGVGQPAPVPVFP
jgi:hypothetical protein